ncbi:MAG: DUF1273 family protein [Clostridia bacterium]|nr:DUF1273 family protein [Clostridia bacterium]
MKTCCVIGHRDFEQDTETKQIIKELLILLIEKENITEFLFGSKSNFNDFCYDVVTELMNNYSNLKRVFVRAEYPVVSDNYINYLKGFYEDSYFYDEKLMTNKFSHIRRNQFMVDKSDVCVFYYNEKYKPKTNTKSGTFLAYEYAIKKGKRIFNVFNIKKEC